MLRRGLMIVSCITLFLASCSEAKSSRKLAERVKDSVVLINDEDKNEDQTLVDKPVESPIPKGLLIGGIAVVGLWLFFKFLRGRGSQSQRAETRHAGACFSRQSHRNQSKRLRSLV